jgi:citrate synthase
VEKVQTRDGKGEEMKTRKECLRRYYDSYNTINTSLGGIVDGKIDFCGEDVIDKLAGKLTQTESILLWALGRKPTELETKLIDTLICLNIYPDLRIWSIRVGAYASANASPLSCCFGSSHAVAHSEIYAVGASLKCKRFFEKLLEDSKLHSAEELINDYVKKKVFFPGFGRPLIQGPDERYMRLTELLKQWKYPLGMYTKLLFDIAPLITKFKKIYPNYAALFVALLLDPPFCFDDSRIVVIAHYMVSLPSYLPACEIKENAEHTPLLPLKVSDIIYTGKAKRGAKG